MGRGGGGGGGVVLQKTGRSVDLLRIYFPCVALTLPKADCNYIITPITTTRCGVCVAYNRMKQVSLKGDGDPEARSWTSQNLDDQLLNY